MNRESLIKKYKNLPQYKNMPEAEFNQIIDEKMAQEDLLNSLTFCVNEEEKDYAKNLIDNYLSENSVETFADKETFRQLIDLELIVRGIKEQLKKEREKANPSTPLQVIEQLESLNKQILELKEKLGFIKKDSEDNNAATIIDEYKRKALQYYEEHKGCNIVKCPECNNLFYLLFDKTDYKEIKAAWFRGTHIYNVKVFELYHNKIIDNKVAAEILGVSEFYIDLLYEGIYLKELNDSQNK